MANDILLYENPFMANPKRKRRKRRNPNVDIARALSFKDVKIQGLFGAVLGFAASAMVPGFAIKSAVPTEPLSNWAKGGKIALSLVIAVFMKGVGDAVMKGAGVPALYGGLAGAGALAYKEFAPGTWKPLVQAPVNGIRAPIHSALPKPAGGQPFPNIARNTNQEFKTTQVI